MTATMTATSFVRSSRDDQWSEPAFVVPQRGASIDVLLDQHTAWLRLPTRLADLITRTQSLTGWSFRDLADVLGTSHTTVGKLMNGAVPTARSQYAVDRIEPLLDVLTRLSKVVAPGPALAEVLDSETPTGDRAMEFLINGEWSQAFLAALDVVNGPRPKRPQLRRSTSSRPTATRELR